MALGWLRWRAWAGVAGVAAAAVGVAGVALCDIHLGFTWQAWYLVTSTFTLCGRRGTYGTLRQPPWFHVAGVVLGGHPIPSSSRPCRGSARGKNKRACGPTIHAYIHTYMPTYLHTYTYIHPSMHTYIHTTQLVHTQLTHTYSSTRNLLHTNPSPSLFSLLLSPCHLYLSFAACWKKLTCGVIRSFNSFVEQHSNNE